ncbi:uncharacterized protein [Magallana gigas]|uniref:uncharacterized protein isoform X1 n=2 Tax=Magallana gigas TaxID=29159 RepID=UPI0033415FBB
MFDTNRMSLLGTTIVITELLSTLSAKECNRFNGTCCYNEYFDSSAGKCLICTHGRFGKNCHLPCKRGYYGHLCLNPCECEAHMCNEHTGCKSRQNETSHEKDQNWVVVSLSILVLIVVSVICAVIYLRRGIKRYLQRLANFCLGRDATKSQGCNIVQQQNCMAVEIVANENNLSPDYDEVRFSQLIRNSTDRASLQSSGDRRIENPGEGKFAHFEGVGNAKNEVADYSRLLLRKKHGTCILINTVISEDEGYALLRTNVQKDTNADVSPDPKY